MEKEKNPECFGGFNCEMSLTQKRCQPDSLMCKPGFRVEAGLELIMHGCY